MKAINLRAARRKRGWTQEDLEAQTEQRAARGDGIKVSQAIISRLEQAEGDRTRFDVVMSLADALGVDPKALRFGPEPKTDERRTA